VGIAADHDNVGVTGQGQPVTRPPVQDMTDGLARQPAGGVDPAHPVDRASWAGQRVGQRQRTASTRLGGPAPGRVGSRRDNGAMSWSVTAASRREGRNRRADGLLPAGVFK